jgi:hypothetical protein
MTDVREGRKFLWGWLGALVLAYLVWVVLLDAETRGWMLLLGAFALPVLVLFVASLGHSLLKLAVARRLAPWLAGTLAFFAPLLALVLLGGLAALVFD